MAEEENKKDDGILSTKLGVSKIKEGQPTMAQAIGAGLIYSFLKFGVCVDESPFTQSHLIIDTK